MGAWFGSCARPSIAAVDERPGVSASAMQGKLPVRAAASSTHWPSLPPLPPLLEHTSPSTCRRVSSLTPDGPLPSSAKYIGPTTSLKPHCVTMYRAISVAWEGVRGRYGLVTYSHSADNPLHSCLLFSLPPPSHLSQIISSTTGHLVRPEHELLRNRPAHADTDAGEHLLPVDAELILSPNLKGA